MRFVSLACSAFISIFTRCEKIQLSRKILLLLTSDFNKDSWNKFASDIAMALQVEENTPLDPKVIPVKLHLDAFIPNYIKLGRDILERQTKTHEKHFLERLKGALVPNEPVNNSIPMQSETAVPFCPSEHSDNQPTQNDEGGNTLSQGSCDYSNQDPLLQPGIICSGSDDTRSMRMVIHSPTPHDKEYMAGQTKYTLNYVETGTLLQESMRVNVSGGGVKISSLNAISEVNPSDPERCSSCTGTSVSSTESTKSMGKQKQNCRYHIKDCLIFSLMSHHLYEH